MLPTLKNRPRFAAFINYLAGLYAGSPNKVSMSFNDVGDGARPAEQPAAEQFNWVLNDIDQNVYNLRFALNNVIPATAADIANCKSIRRKAGTIVCCSNDNILRRAYDTGQAVTTFTYSGEAPAGKFFTDAQYPDVGPGWVVIGTYSGSPPGTPIAVWIYDPDAGTLTPSTGGLTYAYPTAFLVCSRAGQAYTWPNNANVFARIETNGTHTSQICASSIGPDTAKFSQLAAARINVGVDRICHVYYASGSIHTECFNGDGSSFAGSSVAAGTGVSPMSVFYSIEFATFLALDINGEVWSIDPTSAGITAFSSAAVPSPSTLDNGFIGDFGWLGFYQDTHASAHCLFAPDFKNPIRLALKENITFFDGECFWFADSSVSGTGYHRTQHAIIL